MIQLTKNAAVHYVHYQVKSAEIRKDCAFVLSEAPFLACSVHGSHAIAKWIDLLNEIYGPGWTEVSMLLEKGIAFSPNEEVAVSHASKLFKQGSCLDATSLVHHHMVNVFVMVA